MIKTLLVLSCDNCFGAQQSSNTKRSITSTDEIETREALVVISSPPAAVADVDSTLYIVWL